MSEKFPHHPLRFRNVKDLTEDEIKQLYEYGNKLYGNLSRGQRARLSAVALLNHVVDADSDNRFGAGKERRERLTDVIKNIIDWIYSEGALAFGVNGLEYASRDNGKEREKLPDMEHFMLIMWTAAMEAEGDADKSEDIVENLLMAIQDPPKKGKSNEPGMDPAKSSD
jgi:hypothetical protein